MSVFDNPRPARPSAGFWTVLDSSLMLVLRLTWLATKIMTVLMGGLVLLVIAVMLIVALVTAPFR